MKLSNFIKNRTKKRMIPFALPDITYKEKKAVSRILESGWLTTGKETESFEKEFAECLKEDVHCIALNSCTAALHLSAILCELNEKSSFFVPALTFTASAMALTYEGAEPIILDIDRKSYQCTGNIIQEKIEKECKFIAGKLIHQKNKKHIKAIVCVHYAGRPCMMDEMIDLAKKYNLKIIEDAAHAFPAQYKKKMIGTIGHTACFSFYATKNMTTGEGGMLVTKNADWAQKARQLKLHGIKGQTYGRKRWSYDVLQQGYKYNMSDVQAAIGRVQLTRVQKMWQKRHAIHELYSESFQKIPYCVPSPSIPSFCSESYHLYTLEILNDAPLSRDELVEKMRKQGIQLSLHFIPLYRLSYYKNKFQLKEQEYPHCERIFANILSLPIYSRMPLKHAKQVAHAIVDSLS